MGDMNRSRVLICENLLIILTNYSYLYHHVIIRSKSEIELQTNPYYKVIRPTKLMGSRKVVCTPRQGFYCQAGQPGVDPPS